MAEFAPLQLSDPRYAIDRELGRGGMATVYLATDLRHARPVAIKVLRPDLSAALGAERFQREIQLASRLQHPHILPVFDSGESDGRLWYAMPFVAGESLADRLAREGQLPIDDAIRIAAEVADALDYAHANGVVHRDVKPGNIMLSSGHALLSDLGIAAALDGPVDGRLTESGMVVGTPAYMSPEQAAGGRVDGRTDLYSLGCVAYEMLAGEPPFTGPTPQAVIARRMLQPPSSIRIIRPQLPPALDAAVARSLSVSPADRYPTGAALKRALEAARVSMAPPRRGVDRRWLIAGAAAMIFAVAALSLRTHQAGQVAAAVEVPTVAVLPFSNLGDTADAYFAAGITEEVGTRLADLPALHVIARTSTAGYVGSQAPMAQVGRELGARYLLTGSVRYAREAGQPSKVRVTPRLVEAETGRSLWSHDYDATLASVFSVQSSIAEDVARALDVALRPAQVAVLTRVPTSDTIAYEYYLRGMHYAGTPATSPTRPKDLETAADFFRRATELDHSFALAYAMLSRTHTSVYANYYDRTSGRLARAKQAADVALQLAPDLPEAHVALAGYYTAAGDNDAALREYEKVEHLQPSNAAVQYRLGRVRAARGEWAAAAASLEAAVRLDPRSPSTPTFVSTLGWTLYYMRRYADAGRWAQRTLDLTPDDMDAHALAAAVQAVGYGDTAMARRITWEGVTRGSVEQLSNLSDVGLFLLARSAGSAALVARLTPEPFGADTAYYALWKASFYHSAGDPARERAYADSARARYAAILVAQPDEPLDHRNLALAFAYLGRRAEALAEARRAAELLPIAADAMLGTDNLINLARVAALVGDTTEVIQTAGKLLGATSWVSPAYLQIDPLWSPYRDLPEFRRLLPARP